MKIYTKTGDQGTTSLIGGTRIAKCDERLEAYGTIDELGAVVAVLRDSQGLIDSQKELLDKIQECLLIAECRLAVEDDKNIRKNLPSLKDEDVNFLEQAIDRMNVDLEPLNHLVIPGGNIQASQCHVCRTVCRRAERAVVRLNNSYPVEPVVMSFMNRLSDFFFVFSRTLMKQNKVKEIIWKPKS